MKCERIWKIDTLFLLPGKSPVGNANDCGFASYKNTFCNGKNRRGLHEKRLKKYEEKKARLSK